MKNTNTSRKQFISVISEKTRACADALTFSSLGKKFGIKVRDNVGLTTTFSNIYKIANSYYDIFGSKDFLAGAMATNFSSAGYSDISTVHTVGAMDVTLRCLAQSLVPHLAIDRALADQSAIISYMDLVAVNNVNGVKAGDTVVGNFSPIESPSLFLQRVKKIVDVEGAEELTTSLSTLLVPGHVTARLVVGGTKEANYKDAEKTVVAADYKADGILVFGNARVTGTVCYNGTNGVAGQITLSGEDLSGFDTLIVEADEDGTSILDANNDGDAQLTLKLDWKRVRLDTRFKMVNIAQNILVNAVHQKISAQASLLGAVANPTATAFQRVTSLYIEDVNADLIKTLIAAHAQTAALNPTHTLDLTGMSSSLLYQRPDTRETVVFEFFVKLVADFLQRTGMSPTVCVCDTNMATELRVNQSKFVRSETWSTVQNGIAGVYDGIPVFRSLVMDRVARNLYTPTRLGLDDETAAKYPRPWEFVSSLYLAAKTPDNDCGTLVFGEFLPLTQLSTSTNFSNLLQSAAGFYSCVGIAAISDRLVSRGAITKNNAVVPVEKL